MTPHIITINPKLLIDIEGAYISYSQETRVLNKESLQRSSLPFSEIKKGKFRKLFDRHTLAYKH